MSHYSTGCLTFSYDPQTDVVYRTLDFIGYPIYCVGTDGSLWSKHNCNKGLRNSWKQVNGHPDQAGYPCTRLHYGTNHKAFRFHRLVLLAFHGCGLSGMVCRHLNGQPKDNRVENVCWGTYKENREDSTLHGTDDRGEKSSRAILTEEDVREIYEWYSSEKYKMKEISNRKKVSTGTVFGIVNGKSWRHLGLSSIKRGSLKGTKHGGTKLNADIIREVRTLHSDGISAYRIAKKFKVSGGTILAVITGKTWSHVK